MIEIIEVIIIGVVLGVVGIFWWIPAGYLTKRYMSEPIDPHDY